MTSLRRLSGRAGSRSACGRVAPVLVCVLLVLSGSSASLAADPAAYQGRKLVEVLNELQQQGLDLIFSSAVVDDNLRVVLEPSASDPRAVLTQILEPLGLRAQPGPGKSLLILPAKTRKFAALSGRVISLTGGFPVAGATVRLRGRGERTTTDEAGAFAIDGLPDGEYTLEVAAPGYSPAKIQRVRVDSDGRPELVVRLRVRSAFVTEVVVTPNRHSLVRDDQVSRRTVTDDEAVLVPTIGGDVTRVVAFLPGVTTAGNSAAINVRGNVAGDVSIMLDGLELYDPFHLQSFQSPFSLVDGNVVERIDFFGGGFTADLGDRHGGFIDISTLAPEDSGTTQIELGSLNSRLSYQAPLRSGSASWLVSARGWYPESIVNTTELGGGEKLDPRFGDLYAKLAIGLGPRHRLSAHLLFAYDRLKFLERGEAVNESVDALTRNGYAWFRAQSAWTNNLTSETIVSGGRIERLRHGLSAEDGPIVVDDDRKVDFFGFKHDAVWQVSDNHLLKAGLDLRRLDASYRYLNDVTDDPSSSSSFALDPGGTSLGAYAAYRTRAARDLTLELGARWDRQTYTNDNQLSPRFNAVWKPGEKSELRVALGRFNQSQRIHELNVEDGETRFSRAEVAEQVEMSYQRGLGRGLRFRVDAYYRTLTKLQARYENLFEPIELFPETNADRSLVVPEKARLQGIELLLRNDVNRPFFWWVSYVLSSADDIIAGSPVPRSWDQEHAGKFLLGYRSGEQWSVSLTGSVHTGWPTTPVLAEVTVLPDGSTEIEGVPGERNTERFERFSRIDFKARRWFALRHGRLGVTLEVINLTDRDSPCCLQDVFFRERPDGSVDVSRSFDYWLGFTPSLGVLWEF